jgi:hypothetical protein
MFNFKMIFISMTVFLQPGFHFSGEMSNGGVEVTVGLFEPAGLNQLIKPCKTSLNGLWLKKPVVRP